MLSVSVLTPEPDTRYVVYFTVAPPSNYGHGNLIVGPYFLDANCKTCGYYQTKQYLGDFLPSKSDSYRYNGMDLNPITHRNLTGVGQYHPLAPSDVGYSMNPNETTIHYPTPDSQSERACTKSKDGFTISGKQYLSKHNQNWYCCSGTMTGWVESTAHYGDDEIWRFHSTSYTIGDFRLGPVRYGVRTVYADTTSTDGASFTMQTMVREHQDLSMLMARFSGWPFPKSQIFRELGITFPTIYGPNYGECSMAAVDSLKGINCNNIANLSDLAKVKTVTDLLPGKYDDLTVKGLASIYLWYKYSFENTARDISEIRTALPYLTASADKPRYKVQGKSSLYEGDQPYTVNCTLYGTWEASSVAEAIFRKLEQTGLDLSGQTIWDLIPFSFVVDWFFPVGKWLGYADLRMKSYANRYGIDYAVYSCKALRTIARHTAAYDVDITTSYYERWVSRRALCLENYIPSEPHGFNGHLAESAAIITSCL